MRLLGVDLGMKRTGLAISDELGISVRPLPNLTPRSRKEDVDFLVQLCRDNEVQRVLIGIPPHGPMHKRAQGFAEALQLAIPDVPVELVDEARSSIHASARLVESGTKRSERKEALDSEVARGLVLDWLATHRS